MDTDVINYAIAIRLRGTGKSRADFNAHTSVGHLGFFISLRLSLAGLRVFRYAVDEYWFLLGLLEFFLHGDLSRRSTLEALSEAQMPDVWLKAGGLG
jgi:hypothetical protein